jgi:Na+-translocating ferredoxin:NAD+ oxidoreductase RnfG subunit
MKRGSLFLGLMLGLFLMAVTGYARAEVYHSKESALRLAFPGADSVDKREIFLDSGEADRAEQLARAELLSRLVTMYVGRRGNAVVGYAFIETHKVRSLPETILVVLEPDGRTRGVYMLAFHEPPEYAPSDGWLRQFDGLPLDDKLSLRGDVDGITGATLTANAVTAAVRRILAVYETAVRDHNSEVGRFRERAGPAPEGAGE